MLRPAFSGPRDGTAVGDFEIFTSTSSPRIDADPSATREEGGDGTAAGEATTDPGEAEGANSDSPSLGW